MQQISSFLLIKSLKELNCLTLKLWLYYNQNAIKEQIMTKLNKKENFEVCETVQDNYVYPYSNAADLPLEVPAKMLQFAQVSEQSGAKNNKKNKKEVESSLELPTSKTTDFEQEKFGNETNRSVMHSLSLNDAGRVVASLKRNQIDSYDELENYKKLIKKRRKRLIARIFTFLLLLIIAPVMIFLSTIIIDKNGKHDFFGLTFYIVISESMEPEIMVNDCVILKKVKDIESLKPGDDIGYINDNGDVVIHRIHAVVETASGLEFETGGINNNSLDQKRVKTEQIVGIRIETLTVVGQTIVFFRSTTGIILFSMLFAGVIVAFIVAFRMSENIRYIENVE